MKIAHAVVIRSMTATLPGYMNVREFTLPAQLRASAADLSETVTLRCIAIGA